MQVTSGKTDALLAFGCSPSDISLSAQTFSMIDASLLTPTREGGG